MDPKQYVISRSSESAEAVGLAMELVSPETFLELLGAGLFVIAVVFAFLSLFGSIQSVTLRLSAMISLAALAIFANHWSVYFAAVFIIATAVTELEFLHVLAAIVRGDKNYFDFRREFLTREEALRKTRHDAELDKHSPAGNEVQASPSNAKMLRIPVVGSQLRGSAIAFQVEERALSWFENTNHVSVQRYVRFRGEGGSIELDGLIEGLGGTRDTLIEVRWVRYSRTAILDAIVDHTATIVGRYKAITKRKARLMLLLVTPDATFVSEDRLTRLRDKLAKGGEQCEISIVSYTQLGIIVDTADEKPEPNLS